MYACDIAIKEINIQTTNCIAFICFVYYINNENNVKVRLNLML